MKSQKSGSFKSLYNNFVKRRSDDLDCLIEFYFLFCSAEFEDFEARRKAAEEKKERMNRKGETRLLFSCFCIE